MKVKVFWVCLVLVSIFSSCSTSKITRISCPDFKQKRAPTFKNPKNISARTLAFNHSKRKSTQESFKDSKASRGEARKALNPNVGIALRTALSKFEKGKRKEFSLDKRMIFGASLNSKLEKFESLQEREGDCDTIVDYEGNEIECKVLEINSDFITYKSCGDQEEGPIQSVNKEDVLMIHYADGTYESIEIEGVDSEEGASDELENHRSAITGMVLGILSLVVPYLGLLFAIIGLIVSLGALKKLSVSPSVGKEKEWPLQVLSPLHLHCCCTS